MKSRLFFIPVAVFSAFILLSCNGPSEKEKLRRLKDEVKQDLVVNLLPYWMEKVADTVHGGFYGRIGVDDRIYPEAERGGVVNSRILWTFSSAYRVLRDTAYLKMADRAKEYILKYFIDKEYGGAYRSVNYLGEPLDTRKQIYIQSFFMYAFSEYSRATGDTSAIGTARDIYECIEKYSYDTISDGYFELFTRDWKRNRARLIGEKSDREEKTMNTHLHLLESYTSLYRVWPDPVLKEKLRDLILIFDKYIIDHKRYHLISFMERDWKKVSNTDSFGHDIESSWLLCEAANVLGDPALEERIKKISLKIADAASEGLWPDGSLATEKDLATGHTGTLRSWWEQAETIVGFLNAWELTGNSLYLDRAAACWEYVQKQMIDHENGGWYSTVTESGIPGASDKAGFWICPYHNGRMCLEVIERIDHIR